MSSILLRGGRVWDGERFFFSDVLIEDTKIKRISENIEEDADFLFDITGKTVSAGLVDAHIHIRGISSVEFGAEAEMSAFPFGVTAVAEASAVFGGCELLDMLTLKSVVFVPVDITDKRANLESAKALLDKFGERAVGVKVFFDKFVSGVTDTAPLLEICAFAQKHGLRVLVHSSNSPVSMAELLSVLNTGDILTHAYHGGENSAMEDRFMSIRTARRRGVFIDAGLAGHIHTDFRVFADAIASGAVPDIISTDITKRSAFVRGGRYGLTMCMSIARHLGLSEDKIFAAVTSNPARALGKAGEWGALKVGGAADIAVLDYTSEGFELTDKAGNHIESRQGYRCWLTILDGQVVYKD